MICNNVVNVACAFFGLPDVFATYGGTARGMDFVMHYFPRTTVSRGFVLTRLVFMKTTYKVVGAADVVATGRKTA